MSSEKEERKTYDVEERWGEVETVNTADTGPQKSERCRGQRKIHEK
jgi:hypothetical protein